VVAKAMDMVVKKKGSRGTRVRGQEVATVMEARKKRWRAARKKGKVQRPPVVP